MTGLPTPAHPSSGRDRPSSGRYPGQRLRIADSTVDSAQARPVDSPASGLRWLRRYRDRLRITDSVVVVVALLAAVAVRWSVVGNVAGTAEPFPDRLGVPVVIAVTWLSALAAFHTRDPHIMGSGAVEYKRTLNATATAFGLLAIAFLVVQAHAIRWYFIVALPLGAGGLLLGRWTWRRWLRSQRAFGHYLSRAIIVGTRLDIEYVAAQIARDPSAGYVVAGAVTDGDGPGDLLVRGERIPVVADADGDVEDIAAAAAAYDVDAVIVSGQFGTGSEAIRQLSWNLEGTAAELVLSSRLTDVAGPRIHFRPVEGLPLLHVEIPSFDGGRHILKRAFDLVFASLALALLLPVFIAIAICIRLDDGGPALFRQTRCGRDGRTFEMLKFRSMVPTAERDRAALRDRNDGSGLLFKLRADPRVTRLGGWLRKYSLDELPQLWNILVGDMSFVGPRPPLCSEAEQYDSAVRRRLFIKPGLTGLWQISGRSDLGWEEGVRLDLYYVENWSLLGDLMILWRTAKVVAKSEGAY